MNQQTNQLLFALLRCAIRGNQLLPEERKIYSQEMLPNLMAISKKHDLSHLVAEGLNINAMIPKGNKTIGNEIIEALYRYDQLNYELEQLCDALEAAKIPFIPLKGSVLRKWYPEPWMRTSCDIDILVRNEHLDRAISYLVEELEYVKYTQTMHDVSFFTKNRIHIELHFDLVEEDRAESASVVLRNVWNHAVLKTGKKYWLEMTEEYFYFYHVAHMAKHFETGGCGIRPFIDLWILDNIDGMDKIKRDELLKQGGLLKFANASRRLSRCWFECEELDDVSLKLQNFILTGGVYGSVQNRTALEQTKNGGKIRYILSRIFVSYDILKEYYPVLKKHRWLMPIIQLKRWFMLLKPSFVKRTKNELSAKEFVEKSITADMSDFLNEVGL